MMFVCADVNS